MTEKFDLIVIGGGVAGAVSGTGGGGGGTVLVSCASRVVEIAATKTIHSFFFIS